MTKKSRFLVIFLCLGIAATGAMLSSLAGMFLYLSPKLPSVASIRELPLETPLRIYSADEKLIGEIGEKRRIPLTIEQIPELLVNAIIATEDQDFYKHSGVSIKGILRAVVHIIKTGRKGPGGSTVTQQITRHVFLHLRQEFTRKFNEIILARKLEQELNKNEIMALYCNYMFLGKRAHGVGAAAQVYYGKDISELNLAQLAMIAGIFQAPSGKNPINNPSGALERRNHVLGRMLTERFIDKASYEDAISQPISASQHGRTLDLYAPYIEEMARAEAVRLFGQNASREGYEVYTTVDSKLQKTAQEAMINGLTDYDIRHGFRGPELQLQQEILVVSPEGVIDYSPWLKDLAAIPVYANMHPAVVSEILTDKVTFILADGSTVDLGWEGNLDRTRLYVNESVTIPPPKTSAELLETGDVVRLREVEEGSWKLAQIPVIQGALVSLSPKTGAILALSGGFNFHHSNFNRAVQAARQPGSNFKPFIYATALEFGLTPATIINDAPVVYEYDEKLETDWRPKNSGNTFSGPTRLRRALYRSTNSVTIRALNQIGVQNTVKNMGKFGFDEAALPKNASLALGTLDVTPLNLAGSYAIFSNGGYKIEPWLIDRIVNMDGEIVHKPLHPIVCKECDIKDALEQARILAEAEQIENPDEVALSETSAKEELDASLGLSSNASLEPIEDLAALSLEEKIRLNILQPEDYPRAPRVLDEQVAFIIDSMLVDVIRRGTGYRARQLGRADLAGKTGTTNGPRDAWFSGYNGDIVTTAWVGFDQYTPMGNAEFGGTAALPIWMEFMKVALEGKPQTPRVQPPGVVSVKIDPETGKRARVDDPDAIFEYFRVGNVPPLAEPGEQPGTYEQDERDTEEIF